MISGVKSRLKCYALHVIFIKRIQDSIRNKLNNSNFNLKPENDEGNNENFEKIIKATLKALLDQLDSLVRSFISLN